MHADSEFPAVAALTESAISAIRAAEAQEQQAARARRHGRLRRGGIAALVVLGVVTPAAIALKDALGPNTVPATVPLVNRDTGRVEPVDATGVVVAEGFRDSKSWTIYARRCEADGRVSIADAAAIGFRRRSEPGGISTCTGLRPDPDRPGISRPNGLTYFRTRGLSVLYGFVPSAVSTVDVTATSRENPRVVRSITLTADPIPDELVREGELPSGYSLYHDQIDEDLVFTSAVARDSTGRAILLCTPGECHRPEGDGNVPRAIPSEGPSPRASSSAPSARCVAVSLKLVGLTEQRAGRYARSKGCGFSSFRRSERGSKSPTNFRPTRINAATDNGRVTAIASVG